VVRFEDAVFGNLEKAGEELEDFVIVRATGQPTYQLGVVADDLDMRISHVVRGADHIANTPKQILLYRALGATPPRFAHVPLILGPDRSRLSKRHGATSVLAYRDEGIPAEAFVNFLALLGWSDGTDREMFAPEDLADVFSLDGVQRSDAVFDPDKLSWFSGQYINALPVEALLVRLKPFMEARGVWEDRFGEGSGREWLTGVVALIRPRYRSLVTLAAEIATYSGDDVDFEDAAIEKFLKDPNLKDYLPRLAERLEMLESYDARTTEDALRALADELGVKAGLLINASRVALTGKAVAPSMFDVMAAVGQTRTVRRLREAVGRVPAVPTDAPEPGRASV
jgi:glutamyl-tRNA synthetase